ncbi:DUF2291 domain-containing protein [Paracoccus caeni]|uniref:DUF2291 domain-containing protein n=1 Tax=Paracoccus caeni TaxID=657651 RepID=A0A934SL42_9RHOB|nr:DUF2291 domain-containing protein [Paracoccus caeni]MBK4217084.1 DUF2291 domain-containing protein [Paracoccus caeni]
MTDHTAPNQPRAAAPKALRPSRRGIYITVATAALVLAGIAFDTTVVHIGSDADVRQQAFSPDTYGTEQFPRIQTFVTEKAVDAQTLAEAITADKDAAVTEYGTAASTGAIIPIRVSGIAGEARSGVYPLTVEGVPEDITIRVQTGPAINGTELRDVPGDIAFGQFKNQIEYQDAGSGINRAMKAAILDPIDTATLQGKTVEVVGAFRLINPKNWMITPVEVNVQ